MAKALLVLTLVALFAFSRAAQLRTKATAPSVSSEPLRQVMALLANKDKSQGSYENAFKANDLLNDIILKLIQDQDQANLEFQQASQQCDDDVAELNGKINNANAAISGLNAELTSLAADIAKLNEDLANAENKLNRTMNDCHADTTHMQSDIDGMNEDLKIVNEILRMFDEDYEQQRVNTTSMSQKFQKSLAQKASKMVSPKALSLAAALALIKPSASVGAYVGDARSLIQMLHDQLAAGMDAAQNNLNNRRTACQDLTTSIGAAINNLHSQIGQKNDAVARASSDLQQQSELVVQLQKQLDATNAHCSATREAYAQRTSDRSAEVELVKKIQVEVRKLMSDRGFIQDCVVSDWADWSHCSASCGGGQMTRSRQVLKAPTTGLGMSCPALDQTEQCNMEACPVNCEQSDWSDWSACSAECGNGFRVRTRNVIQEPANGGIACGPNEEREPCFIKSCDVDCVLGSWGDWSACSVDCGQGTQTRTQNIAEPAKGNGKCNPPTETQTCNGNKCSLPEGSSSLVSLNNFEFIRVPFVGPKTDNQIRDVCHNAGLLNPCITDFTGCGWNNFDVCKKVGFTSDMCGWPLLPLSKAKCGGNTYPTSCPGFEWTFVYMGDGWNNHNACGAANGGWCSSSQSIPQGQTAYAVCVRP